MNIHNPSNFAGALALISAHITLISSLEGPCRVEFAGDCCLTYGPDCGNFIDEDGSKTSSYYLQYRDSSYLLVMRSGAFGNSIQLLEEASVPAAN